MFHRRLLILLCFIIFPSIAFPGEDNWWAKEDAGDTSPLIQKIRGDDYAVLVNWADGYIEVVGEASCDPDLAVNKSHCYSMAVKAARALAYEKLAESIHGVRINSRNTFQDEVIQNTSLKTAVKGLVQGARIIEESSTTMADGSLLVRVRLGLLLQSPKGLSGAVVQHIRSTDSSAELAKLSADVARLSSELMDARTRADQMEELVQNIIIASEPSNTDTPQMDMQDVQEALQRASAAIRIAEDAQNSAKEISEHLRELENSTTAMISVDSLRTEIDDLRSAMESATALATRLEGIADDARNAADEARRAGSEVSEQGLRFASYLEHADSLSLQLKHARMIADESQRKTEDALNRLLEANTALAQSSPSTRKSIEEAQSALNEARLARQESAEILQRLDAVEASLENVHTEDTGETATVRFAELTSELEELRTQLANSEKRQTAYQSEGAAALEKVTQSISSFANVEKTTELEQAISDLQIRLEESRALTDRIATLEERSRLLEQRNEEILNRSATVFREQSTADEAMAEARQTAHMIQSLLDSLQMVRGEADHIVAATRITTTDVQDDVAESYTGLIIDAAYLSARAALKPRILSEDGDFVYGDHIASRETALRLGYATWSETPGTAREKAIKRIGTRPLVVRAVDATGKYRSDLVVSREDAVLIERANQASGFLKECKVAIAIMPQA